MKAILPYGIAIYLEQRPTKSDNGSHFCWYSSDSSLVCVPNFMKPLLFTQQWLSPADHVWQWNLHCCDRGLLFGDFPWFQAWHASDGNRARSSMRWGKKYDDVMTWTGFPHYWKFFIGFTLQMVNNAELLSILNAISLHKLLKESAR